MVSFGKRLEDDLSNPNALELSKGERNRNPGNIEDGPFARSQPGYKGSDGRFAIFDSPESGRRAQEQLLAKNYKGMSPAQVVQKYAPLGDNSEESVRNYIGYAASRAGIDPDKPVPPAKLSQFAAAMREFETGNRPGNFRFNPYGGQLTRRGGGGRSVATGNPSNIKVPDIFSARASQAEQLNMSGGYEGVQNPFDSQAAQAGVERVQQRGSIADSILQAATAEQEQLRTDRLQNLDSTVAARKALYQHGQETTQALINAAKPLFARKQQVADRMLELQDMNPLEAAFRGAFDPNYNEAALRGTSRALDSKLAVLDEQYSMDYKLHQNLIALTTAESADQDALLELQIENSGEKVKAAVQSFQMAGSLLDGVMSGFQTDSALLAARVTAQKNFLANASDGQLGTLAEQAQANGGLVNVEGIELSGQALREEQLSRQDQAYNLAFRQMALENNLTAYAEQAEEKVLTRMNKAQVIEAIQANGMYKGQQLDLVKLNQRLNALGQGDAVQAQESMLDTAGGQLVQMVTGYTGQTKGYNVRLAQMLGRVPDEFSAQITSDFNRLTAAAKQVRELAASGQEGAARQLAVSLAPEIQAMVERRNKLVEKSVSQWSGGNADLKNIGMAWASGNQVEPGTAMRGMIHMARNGTPAGMQFSGASAKVFQVVRDETLKFDRRQAGDDALKGDAATRDNALVQQIQGALAREYNADGIDRLMLSAPAIAQRVMYNGRRHPFSMVKPEAVQQSMRNGDEVGYQRLAEQLSLTVPQVKQMFREGQSSALWQEKKKGLQGEQANFGYWGSYLTAAQTEGFLRTLDTFRTDDMPFQPAAMLRDLMSRPEFRAAARTVSMADGMGSLGGFVATTAAGGGFENAASNYGQIVSQAHNTYAASQLATITNKSTALRNQPLARAHFLIKSIPGLTTDDENYLFNALKTANPGATKASELITAGGQGVMIDQSAMSHKLWGELESTILNRKFDDPRAEALRKKVAPVWGQYKESTDKLISSSWFGGN